MTHEDLERGTLMTSSKQNQNSNLLDPSSSQSASPSATSAPALVLTASGKRMDQAGKKKYVKQVTGKHNDTELHLASQRGDLASVKRILDEINSQMVGTLSGADFDAEVAKIRASVVNEVNELGETALYTAAEKGHLEVVKELLKYSDKETLTRRSRLEFDPLHIAASQGHHEIVKLLLDHDVSLCQTRSQGNATPLITAASKGHTTVVEELLSKDPSLLDIPRSNGKNALHLAARSGHVETVKSLLAKDPQLARRTDKKGQTALHMAVKGASSEVVKLLLEADAAIVMLPDKSGFTALHVATRKKRAEIVNELLCLVRRGAVRANELNQPRDELRNTVTQIKNDVHIQLLQTKKTNKNVHGIAKELRKLHREGINNATNSVTVVAVLFATVAFAAIFTVPGGDNDHGMAVVVHRTSFKIFFIFNAIALFTSLAVVVVQITLVRGETKAERKVVEVINKLMWLASVCTSVAFMASSYIVVGRKYEWAAILITVVGGVIMVGVLGTMTYYVVKSKKTRSMRRREKIAKSGTNSWMASEFSNSDVERIYAI
ncbi:putative ankyrin repeat-containing domain, PGG domain, ankyrin repeat-containing domain superfamily [Helianthus annuus]|nr:putative ankyrin repeat-containing domain, PGG domain, ankyrin repeat-containing domain superfamily [Helianthus annuus]